jgi:hypothetical protein
MMQTETAIARLTPSGLSKIMDDMCMGYAYCHEVALMRRSVPTTDADEAENDPECLPLNPNWEHIPKSTWVSALLTTQLRRADTQVLQNVYRTFSRVPGIAPFTGLIFQALATTR